MIPLYTLKGSEGLPQKMGIQPLMTMNVGEQIKIDLHQITHDKLVEKVQKVQIVMDKNKMAQSMQEVDFDNEDIIVLKGNKISLISMSAGIKISNYLISRHQEWLSLEVKE